MEEKEVITVENEGGKGNPNHKPAGSPDGGQFTSKNEAEGGFLGVEKDEKYDDEMGVIEIKEEKELNPLKSAMLQFAGKKKEALSQQARDYMASIASHLKEEQINYIENLSREDRITLLSNNKIAGYDPIKLKFASDDQLKALLYAEMIQNAPKSIEQQKILLDKAKEDLNSQKKEELAQSDAEIVTGIWKYINPKPSQYTELKNSGSYDAKVEYFQKILDNPDALIAEKAKATQNMAKLKKFAKDGEAYEQLKSEIDAKYVDKFEEIEQKYSELSGKLSAFYDENGQKTDLVKSADAYCDKFKDINSAYSKARKDKAVWINQKWMKEHPEFDDGTVYGTAIKYFGPKFEKMWNNMTTAERNQLIDYTGGGFSKYNKPLRGLAHSGWSGFGFSTAITNLTNAIDKCTWEEDIWVQRGISDANMFKLPGSNKLRSLFSMTPSELQSLVGNSFKENGFYSAGAGKGTGFSHGNVILNTYCPKGTKMAYMNTKGHYAYGSENEMILQRGYSYRITKVEKKGSKFYIDCEVILGSDSDKITDVDELEKIGKKHLG